MKTKTTKKAIYDNYGKDRTFSFGYCEIQFICRLFENKLYTCGVYGWNADILQFNNFVLCTGYRPFGTTNKEIQSICKEINEKVKNDNEYYLHLEIYINELEARINQVLNK